MKGKKGITITNAFQKVLDKNICKPKQLWVDKDSEFYNRSMKSRLQDDNDIEMRSAHNQGKSIVAERIIGTLKSKFYKLLSSVPKNVDIDTLDDTVNEYNNVSWYK